jgi:hypothetical protein
MTNNGMPYLQIHMPRSRTWTSQFSEETTDTGGAVAKVAWQHASIVWNWEEVMASRRPGSSPSDSFGRLGVLSWRAPSTQGQSNPTWHDIVLVAACISIARWGLVPRSQKCIRSRLTLILRSLEKAWALNGLLCWARCFVYFVAFPLPKDFRASATPRLDLMWAHVLAFREGFRWWLAEAEVTGEIPGRATLRQLHSHHATSSRSVFLWYSMRVVYHGIDIPRHGPRPEGPRDAARDWQVPHVPGQLGPKSRFDTKHL